MMGEDENICSEGRSGFIRGKSPMESLCPECSHYLYSYPKCRHIFRSRKASITNETEVKMII